EVDGRYGDSRKAESLDKRRDRYGAAERPKLNRRLSERSRNRRHQRAGLWIRRRRAKRVRRRLDHRKTRHFRILSTGSIVWIRVDEVIPLVLDVRAKLRDETRRRRLLHQPQIEGGGRAIWNDRPRAGADERAGHPPHVQRRILQGVLQLRERLFRRPHAERP